MGADRLAALIEAQRPHLALWIPVFFALGIALYFAVPAEPEGVDAGGARRRAGRRRSATLFRVGPVARVLLLALLLPGLGFGGGGAAQPAGGGAGAAARDDGERRGADRRARPLGQRPAAGAARPGGDPRAGARARRRRGCGSRSTPRRRPTCCGPALRLLGQARLSPPAAPSEPGGFDFRRLAWFERIGAVGYARTPMVEADGPRPGALRQLAFRVADGGLGAYPAAGAGAGRRLRRGDPDRRPLGDRPGGRGGAAGLEPLPHRLDLGPAHDAAGGGGLRDDPLRAGAGAAAGAALAAEEDRGGGGAGRRCGATWSSRARRCRRSGPT